MFACKMVLAFECLLSNTKRLIRSKILCRQLLKAADALLPGLQTAGMSAVHRTACVDSRRQGFRVKYRCAHVLSQVARFSVLPVDSVQRQFSVHHWMHQSSLPGHAPPPPAPPRAPKSILHVFTAPPRHPGLDFSRKVCVVPDGWR